MQTRIHSRHFAAIALGLLLAGCQGGQGSNATKSARESTRRAQSVPPAAAPAAAAGPKTHLRRASVPARPARPVADLTLPWGSGPAAVGYLGARESAPEGPQSFDVDAQGRIYLLDTVNGRILVAAAGRVVRSIPLPSVTYGDVAVDARGDVLAVLDRSVGQHVAVYAGDRTWRFADLPAEAVPEPGGVTALAVRRDGIWVEWAHQWMVRIADRGGRADPRHPRAWGRFAPGGDRLVRAVRAGAHEVVLLARRRGAARPGIEVLARAGFDLPVRQVLGVAVYPDGGAALAVHQVETAPEAEAVVTDRVTVLRVGGDGEVLWRTTLPPSVGGAIPRQVLRRGRDGGLYYLQLARAGATVWRVDP